MSSTPTRRRRATALLAATAVVAAGAAGTSALFTDREVVDANSFTSGSLDLVAAPATQLFQVRDMAPGDVVANPLHLTNSGTTPLAWTPSVRVADAGKLAERLTTRTFPVADDASCAPGADASGSLLATGGWTDLGETFRGAGDAYLAAGDETVVCLVVGFDYGADLSYSGATANLEWIFDAEQTDERAPVDPGPTDSGRIMQATYSTALPACSDGNVALPISGVVDGATIDWGDGTVEPLVDSASHTYASAGEHQVTIDGQFLKLGNGANPMSDQRCLTSVERWDDGTGTTNLSGAFNGSSAVTRIAEVPSTAKDLSHVMAGSKAAFDNDLSGWDVAPTTLAFAFNNNATFDGDLDHWDTSDVTSLQTTFFGASAFDGDVSTWDTSSVTNMSQTFMRATAFDQDLSGWDVSNVTIMANAFNGATSFNGDVSTWKPSSATNLAGAFSGATSFNGDISGWDVSSVRLFGTMFASATSFNQDIGGWDTSSATQMSSMFRDATAFNQDISGWNVSNITSGLPSMFQGATSFNQDLSSWRLPASGNWLDFDTGATSWVLPRPTLV
ncbi:TasA family protein [Cellulosimicrobium sp. Marseille-Q4280]|uniref:TasA family protein n=1 Tax=Cellulosimicrobium sp. Marseille-Q4280 TaxID=2937992 RepID=UPI00203EA303|nr:TasA family protein [Cellulosimicrobium sp. Marseille-Q4280]